MGGDEGVVDSIWGGASFDFMVLVRNIQSLIKPDRFPEIVPKFLVGIFKEVGSFGVPDEIILDFGVFLIKFRAQVGQHGGRVRFKRHKEETVGSITPVLAVLL